MGHRGILVDKCMYHRDTVRSIHTVRGCRHLGALLVKLVGKISLNSVLRLKLLGIVLRDKIVMKSVIKYRSVCISKNIKNTASKGCIRIIVFIKF